MRVSPARPTTGRRLSSTSTRCGRRVAGRRRFAIRPLRLRLSPMLAALHPARAFSRRPLCALSPCAVESMEDTRPLVEADSAGLARRARARAAPTSSCERAPNACAPPPRSPPADTNAGHELINHPVHWTLARSAGGAPPARRRASPESPRSNTPHAARAPRRFVRNLKWATPSLPSSAVARRRARPALARGGERRRPPGTSSVRLAT